MPVPNLLDLLEEVLVQIYSGRFDTLIFYTESSRANLYTMIITIFLLPYFKSFPKYYNKIFFSLSIS